jgi:hypothetical protein
MAHGSRKYSLVVWCVFWILSRSGSSCILANAITYLGVFWVLGNTAIVRMCLVMPSVRIKALICVSDEMKLGRSFHFSVSIGVVV